MTPDSSPLRLYLEQMARMLKQARPTPPEGYTYSSIEAYVLAHGKDYQSAKFTKDELAYARALMKKGRWPIKQCFSNSQQILLRESRESAPSGMRLRYVEGYVTTGIIPLLHGWLSLNDKVLDVTLRDHSSGKRNLGTFAPNYAYYGVEVSALLIQERIRKTLHWGSLLDCYELNYPLLRETKSNSAA